MISEFGTNFEETVRNTAFHVRHFFIYLVMFWSYDKKNEKKKMSRN